ncbi:MAG: alpha-ketoacid dehydrogenase subunit beta [Opitutales bacterium]|jgi:pyruvate dehydrogenase E1 component beta subunit|nr:alpha-ketoacid dehydrogenase subunit beta [Opitutales bacterium]MDP4645305.1 alpha-ketoacid dehydrogenase subunit beta [Opitutales bacterium]MDP4776436.1 alpha-ketoacid dehydrogenase subunit beta [Opitutales bacterium]MDP4878336.1 alpha-ketoacid dehydrogenase subunit beta [Opitutales bacterium]MDP4882984.1 alpha-ketoacid dehydrogenase subunit beta [Opitutales bacterium]
MALITYREAIKQALDEEIQRDENVCIMGEEVAQYNGAYKVTEGLWEKHGDKRVIDTPISEAAFSGLAIGASMLGVRPVIEMMFMSFSYVAIDQLFNNASFCRYMSGGLMNVPIVVRGPANGGTNVGATHSHTPENMVANHPGLKVVCPSNAYDAKGLMKAAIRDNDPVFVMENTLLYGEKWEVPEEEYIVELGVANILKEGTDMTIISHGRCAMLSLQAAKTLEEKHGISVEVVDLRSIRPLDEETILNSVKKTGRALLVEENKPYCGVDAQISHIIQLKAFDYLDGPIHRVSAIDAPQIYAKPLEDWQIPNEERIITGALKCLS